MKKKILRIVALFIAINLLTTTLMPTLSYALTAGSTAPEFSSFEPVDTNTMVDIATGDFTYNVPLLDIPGPEGGYPMALSYHAGIMPELEASWVGLGWTLNPGAINRIVNGYADDYSESIKSVQDSWVGGSTKSFTVGLGIGTINAAVTFASDTYKGNGIGVDAMMGYNFTTPLLNSQASIGLTASSPPFEGGGVLGVAASVNAIPKSVASATGINVVANVGITTNFQTVNVCGGVGVGLMLDNSISLIGANLNSNSKNPEANIAGYSSHSVNNKQGKISSSSKGWDVSFMVASLSYNYVRYWSDETSNGLNYGVLHYEDYFSKSVLSGFESLDSYSIPDPDSPDGISGMPEQQTGGSLPAYDYYSVSGQGIGGQIQPYVFENTNLRRENINNPLDPSTKVRFGKTNQGVGKVNFRFKGDFSNYLAISDPSFISSVTNTANISLTEEIRTTDDDFSGFNSANNKLAGSRHVEWFTNDEIKTGTAYNKGFLSFENTPQDRIIGKYDDVNVFNLVDQIGGFMLTNSSGVNYHYSLPVYAYDEVQYNESSHDGDQFRKVSNKQPYATNWLLTGITGPDYYDADNSKTISDGDWGYWVKFDYGMWSDNFIWRTPNEGKKKDLNPDVKFYSSGRKEVYYLDAIRTRTHTAIFVKEIRKDGKGVCNAENGGFIPTSVDGFGLSTTPPASTITGDCCYYNFPTSTMKLNNIYLFQNDQLTSLLLNAVTSSNLNDLKKNGTEPYAKSFDYSGTFQLLSATKSFSQTISLPHYADNVLDASDVNPILDKVTAGSLRSIDFNTDYSLCDQTKNSFDNDQAYQKIPSVSGLSGKLTLNSIRFHGKSGTTVLPAIAFKYNYATDPTITSDDVNNPDYSNDKKDIWGYYKSDWVDYGNDNVSGFVSPASAARTNAWSLKRIESAMGANVIINYESDQYNNSALDFNSTLTIQSFTRTATANRVKVNFYEAVNLLGNYFGNLLQLNASVKITALLRYYGFNDYDQNTKCGGTVPQVWTWQNVDNMVTVKEIGADYIIVEDADLYNKVAILGKHSYDCSAGILGQNVDGNYDFTDYPTLVGGNLFFDKGIIRDGGGLRVSKISILDDERIYSTNYDYYDGVTSFEPLMYKFDNISYLGSAVSDNVKTTETNYINAYRNNVSKNYSRTLALSRIIPGPGVFYSAVEVRQSYADVSGSNEVFSLAHQRYEFETFTDVDNKKIIDKTSAQFVMNSSDPDFTANATRVNIDDFSSKLGNLKSKSLIKSSDNSIINETQYLYLHDLHTDNNDFKTTLGTSYKNQGHVEQVFHEFKYIRDDQTPKLIHTRLTEYPNILIKTIASDNTKGITLETENLQFDYFTGNPTSVLTQDAYGNKYVTSTVPAYVLYSDQGMGIKIFDPTNKNMLTQEGGNLIYKTSPTDNYSPTGLISASMSTWSKTNNVLGVGVQNNVPRPVAQYLWIGTGSMQEDGTSQFFIFSNYVVPASGFHPTFKNTPLYTYFDLTANPAFQKQNEITLYNKYSKAIESKDINGKYISNIYDPTDRFMLTSVSNASHNEIAYSGAEYYTPALTSEGFVNKNQGAISTDFSHTGKYSLKVDPGKQGFSYTLKSGQYVANRKYKASVWVYMPGTQEDELNQIALTSSLTSNSVNPVITQKAGSWYLMTLVVPATASGDIIISAKNNAPSDGRSVYFDDFRVQPLSSDMSSYVYDPVSNELLAILNNNNLYTRFEYDQHGRLSRTYQEIYTSVGEKKVSEQIINYGKKQ
ncbi:MAG TPA: hypothetical protein VNB90_03230 [Cytophagaceae bacterium]|jgi:hypothetical protein|nr:hypothetical protein [Cytophagaceae bacterium]